VLVDHRWDTRQPDYLQRLSNAFELPIVALHNPFASQVEGWADDKLGRLRRTVGLAQELRVSVVVVHLPFRFHAVSGQLHAYRPWRFQLPLPVPRRGPFYGFVKEGVAAMERETGVVLAVENMPAKRFLGLTVNPRWFNSPAEMERFPHLTLDTTHLGTWGLDPLAVYRELRERVAHVHLSNYDGREHRSPPDGRLRLEDLLQALARDGYQGAITVECHTRCVGC
jgi:sugar phosphate isomerase/epimerase